MNHSPYGYDDVADHAWLLLDTERVTRYAKAIRSVVGPDDVVADIGTGSGLLAVLAAKAGARKVYAVELGGVADLATRVFRDNGMQDRITLLRGDARDVEFPEPPTVVVSETLGCFGIDENILALFKLVKARCAPNVRFVPQALRIFFAPVWDGVLAREDCRFADIEGVSFAEVRRRLLNRPLVQYLSADQLRGPAVCTSSLSLSESELPTRYNASLRVSQACEVNVLGSWFEADLTRDITISTSPEHPRTSWMNVKLPLVPALALTPDSQLEVEVEPRLGGGRGLWRWTASVDGQKREGDVLASSGGSLRDFAYQLGMSLESGNKLVGSRQLDAWAAILNGNVDSSIDAMAARLLAAKPERYADLPDAREEVLRLLSACNAMG